VDGMKIHKPQSIQEAIDDLQTFLEVDLYSKFRPEKKIQGEKWYRQDFIKNENDFIDYIRTHFNILKKQVKMLSLKSKEKGLYTYDK
jgi:hypothetical protein